MKKVLIIILIVLILAGAGVFIFANRIGVAGNVVSSAKTSGNANSGSGNVQMVQLSLGNLPAFMESSEIIKMLPADASILLRLYNFNTGERTWEASYLITKGQVAAARGDESVDMVLVIHSKYLPMLGDMCNAVKTAKANGDFGAELKISKTSFMWKYKSLLKYKDCFGF